MECHAVANGITGFLKGDPTTRASDRQLLAEVPRLPNDAILDFSRQAGFGSRFRAGFALSLANRALGAPSAVTGSS